MPLLALLVVPLVQCASQQTGCANYGELKPTLLKAISAAAMPLQTVALAAKLEQVDA